MQTTTHTLPKGTALLAEQNHEPSLIVQGLPWRYSTDNADRVQLNLDKRCGQRNRSSLAIPAIAAAIS